MKQGVLGFSLTELIIVIAIIGILAAFAIPNFLAARGRAEDTAAKQTLQAIKTALEVYTANNGYYPILPDDDLMAFQAAMGGDWPAKVSIGGTDSGTLTGFRSGPDTYAVSAIGRDSSHYYHLQQDGTLSGPDSFISIDD